MLDIETYKKINSGELASFVFFIPKKKNAFTYHYVAKNAKDAIVKLMQDYESPYQVTHLDRCVFKEIYWDMYRFKSHWI